MNVNAQASKGLAIPFDHARLDRLMDEAGIDVLLATSKHNVQYLLGGHRANFFDYMDATGITRYLPVFVYPKGAAGKGRLYRPPPGRLPARGQAAVDAGDADRLEHLDRCHADGGRHDEEGRPETETHRHRISASCPMTPRKCCAPRSPTPTGSTRSI